jgi:phosphoribosylformylglycinamidine synthase
VLINNQTHEKPIDLHLDDLFGNPPKTVLKDETVQQVFKKQTYETGQIIHFINEVLQIEAVACKDYLTNKVDRSVTGKIATQQTAGEIQLPLNNLGVIAIDYTGKNGMATSIGHAPGAGLINEANGSILSIAEALTNILWAPLRYGLNSVSLSANWMWPCKNQGEDARLYRAVEAASDFAQALGINIPTGKDSLSMTQKYPDGTFVRSPGTVIISAGAEVEGVAQTIEPVAVHQPDSSLLYIDMSSDSFKTGGSSLSQILHEAGTETPSVNDPAYFRKVFDAIQSLIKENKILAGHDISAGGLITTLLEMNFPNVEGGMQIELSGMQEEDPVKILFSENPGVVIQTKDEDRIDEVLAAQDIRAVRIGKPVDERNFTVNKNQNPLFQLPIDELRDVWYNTSYLLDKKQTAGNLAEVRYTRYKKQPLSFTFPDHFTGKATDMKIDMHRRASTGVKAAIIREKGVNGDREMAYSMYLAGMDVKDVHMTDLISGEETLEDIHMIVFVGGFSNSDVLGSAKGWAGAFLYNPRAKATLECFYARPDTLSLGICNGCQLMIELNLIQPGHTEKPKMKFNHSGKFESAFLNVNIPENSSVMLSSLVNSRLGIWIAHGEGRFEFPYDEAEYYIPVKYSYDEFPGNPNGSDYATAGICSADGRHLAMMPHIERSVLPWQWAYYPANRKQTDQVSPWIEAFVNAREWILKNRPQK